MKSSIYRKVLLSVKDLWDHSSELKSHYKAATDCPFLSASALSRISNERTNYDQNLLLKEEVSKYMHGDYSIDNYDLSFWIINKWGGISSFHKNNRNIERIRLFAQSLQTGITTLECISSLSKVASFMCPLLYFVYDSRVVYSLNWYLLKAGAQDGYLKKPNGQNTKLKEYKIEDIIRFETGKDIKYYDVNSTYNYYNNLILRLYTDISKEDKTLRYPFEIEMLLFQAAPGIIYNEISQKYSKTKSTNCSEKGASKQSSKIKSKISSPKKDISALDSDQSIMRRRYIEKCLVDYEGAKFFIFVGKDKRKAFCEILSESGKYRKEKELIERGYVMRGGKNPYYIKLFDKNDIEGALAFMNETKRLYSNN